MLWHNSKQENIAQPIGQLGSCHSAARQDYPVVPSHPKQEEKKNQQKKAKIPLNPIVFLFDLDVKFYMCMSCEGYVCSLVWKNAGEGQNLTPSVTEELGCEYLCNAVNAEGQPWQCRTWAQLQGACRVPPLPPAESPVLGYGWLERDTCLLLYSHIQIKVLLIPI